MEHDTFTRFKNRQAAGHLLASKLTKYTDQTAVVYALPRGGVEVGAIIADTIYAPLELIIPRKIGHPLDPEYAIGAVSESGKIVGDISALTAVDQTWLRETIQRESAEAIRRRQQYTSGRPTVHIAGKTAIIADDGVATGLTMRAAILDVRMRAPAMLVVAVPVIPQDIKITLEQQVDKVIALLVPEAAFGSIGAYYDSFEQVEDDAVIALLKRYDAIN